MLGTVQKQYQIKNSHNHQNTHKLAQVQVLVAGYPCVSLSSLNGSPQPFEAAEAKTGSGYHAVMKCIEKYQPPLVILENVRQMLQARKQDSYRKPIDIQNARLSQKYICSYVLANTCECGLPQSRNRVWMMYIRRDQVKGGHISPRHIQETMLWFVRIYYSQRLCHISVCLSGSLRIVYNIYILLLCILFVVICL